MERAVDRLDTLVRQKGVGAAVAALVKVGARGRRNRTCGCVLVDYVRAETDPSVKVEVDPIEVVLVSPGPGRVRIGAGLADLIRRFDAGEFPELEGECRTDGKGPDG